MTLLCGLAQRLRLVDYPPERRVGSSRQGTQLRETGFELRCGRSGRLSKRWQGALDHRGDVRDLAGETLAGVSKPDLAGINGRKPCFHQPFGEETASIASSRGLHCPGYSNEQRLECLTAWGGPYGIVINLDCRQRAARR